MKKINKAILLLVFILSALSLNAQSGKVSGTIMDGEFSEPLAFANILVKGTTTGTTSDFDGKYELELDPGTYTIVFSFVGYTSIEVTDIVIVANADEIVDVTLTTNTLETVVITTSVKRNTENAVLDFQKNSATLLDGLSAQSIKKTGASDVASAVKNVPGVSVEGGKYVYVRGLGDRYTKSILNGVEIPGLDPDRNTIQMDIFPTNILDNIIVIKSASAEFPADFTGGIVDIVTRDFPTKREATISTGIGYNPDMHFNDKYLTYTGSSSDWFGYDNGLRDLPINRYQIIPGPFENNPLLTDLTNRFQKELGAKRDNSGLNFDLGFTYGDQFDVGEDNRLGFQTSFSYKNNTEFFETRIDGASLYDSQDLTNLTPLFTLASTGSEGINTVLVTAMGGLVFKADRSKYKLNVLHIQSGESSAGVFNQVISQDGTGGALEPLTKDALTYTERAVTNVLLNGNHRLSEDENPWTLDWKIAPTFSKVYDKAHRITPLQISDEGEFTISPSASTFPIQLWRWLNEESWVGKVDFDKKHELFGQPAKFKTGAAYTYKFRDFSIDDYTFTISGDDSFIADGNVDKLLAEENLWVPDDADSPHPGEGTHLVFGDQFNPNDAYEGESNLFAAYASSEFNLTEDFKAIIGLRAELFKLYYTGQDGLVVFDRTKTLDEFDLFPSANLIYALSEKANLRGSFSRTTARPSFKEKSASQIFDPITNRLFIGNLDLVPTYINNYDVRYERFGENGQMVAASVFYKDFTDPIELGFFLSAPTQVTPLNLGDAIVYGLEVEFRQRFGFLSENLDNLKLNLNASIIKSELTMSDQEFERRQNAARPGQTIERKRDLQGQSPYLINVGLDYTFDDIGFQTGLFYNVQGETLEVVGTGIVPDVFTQPFNSLNFTARKSFGENQRSTIDLKVTNILGADRASEYDIFNRPNEIFTFISPATEISLGYTYKF